MNDHEYRAIFWRHAIGILICFWAIVGIIIYLAAS